MSGESVAGVTEEILLAGDGGGNSGGCGSFWNNLFCGESWVKQYGGQARRLHGENYPLTPRLWNVGSI